MKKIIMLFVVLCLLFAGCAKTQDDPGETVNPPESSAPETPAASEEPEEVVPAEPAVTVNPLPDTTMENLTDTILSVSLEEGDAYLDDTGRLQMDLKIYSYDKYDMIDVANLKVGDTIVRQSGEVVVESIERSDAGLVSINGGLEAGGFDLISEDNGIFYEIGFNDAKNWYEVGEATIRVSTELIFRDNGDPDAGEVIHYPGSFLVGEVTDYNFTPYNTTIRVEEGQVIEMDRVYQP